MLKLYFRFLDRRTSEQDDQQQIYNDISGIRKYSTTSSVTTDNSKRSSKKVRTKNELFKYLITVVVRTIVLVTC